MMKHLHLPVTVIAASLLIQAVPRYAWSQTVPSAECGYRPGSVCLFVSAGPYGSDAKAAHEHRPKSESHRRSGQCVHARSGLSIRPTAAQWFVRTSTRCTQCGSIPPTVRLSFPRPTLAADTSCSPCSYVERRFRRAGQTHQRYWGHELRRRPAGLAWDAAGRTWRVSMHRCCTCGSSVARRPMALPTTTPYTKCRTATGSLAWLTGKIAAKTVKKSIRRSTPKPSRYGRWLRCRRKSSSPTALS